MNWLLVTTWKWPVSDEAGVSQIRSCALLQSICNQFPHGCIVGDGLVSECDCKLGLLEVTY
jgi:hypothetical protein